MKKRSLYFLAIIPVVLILIAGSGCGQKKTEEQKDTTKAQPTAVQTPAAVDTTKQAADTAAAEKPAQPTEPEKKIPDLTGTWTGTLDQRPTRLTIAKQDGISFEGSITISYREAIHQKIAGSIDPTTNKVRMRDLLHSRYMGTYSGSLSADLATMKGTFTQTTDKRSSSFVLKKK
ncbi:MAG: hypothetical protein QHI48_08880 [Bacteroidota bacterium]|nr:hypothetical protein [Bacteroidota bacterium]